MKKRKKDAANKSQNMIFNYKLNNCRYLIKLFIKSFIL